MDARSIALAVPLFFLLIFVEVLIVRRKGEAAYPLHDAITSMSCGVGQQVLGVALNLVRVGGYAWVYEHLRLATVSPRSALGWIAAFLGVDLCYFAYHWASHRVNFFWATHAVHHQSEEYNLTTALRQSWFTGLTSWLFYLPLAVAGFPPLMFVLMLTANTLYQFWIHTRTVSRLGFLESFLNTPSHHRVHHGVDPRYIDKNYGGVFIVWDRLFGTFAREEAEPVYGTVKPLASFNPVWANIEPWVHLARMARQTQRLRDKLCVWFMPPEWRPADLGGEAVIPEVSRALQRKYDAPSPRGLDAYVIVHFALVTAVASGLLLYASALSSLGLSLIAATVMLTLVTWGALFESRPWAVTLEWSRLALAAFVASWLAWGTPALAWTAPAAAAVALAFGLWVGRYRRRPSPRAAARGVPAAA